MCCQPAASAAAAWASPRQQQPRRQRRRQQLTRRRRSRSRWLELPAGRLLGRPNRALGSWEANPPLPGGCSCSTPMCTNNVCIPIHTHTLVTPPPPQLSISLAHMLGPRPRTPANTAASPRNDSSALSCASLSISSPGLHSPPSLLLTRTPPDLASVEQPPRTCSPPPTAPYIQQRMHAGPRRHLDLLNWNVCHWSVHPHRLAPSLLFPRFIGSQRRTASSPLRRWVPRCQRHTGLLVSFTSCLNARMRHSQHNETAGLEKGG